MRFITRSRAAAALAMVGLLLAACGGDSDDGGDQGSEEGNSRESLTLVFSSLAADLPTRVALAKGFFEEENLDVTLIENASSNTPNIVSAGRADLAGYTASIPPTLAAKGRRLPIIYAMTGGGLAGNVFVAGDNRDVQSLEDLKRVPNCRIGTLPASTSSYGSAAGYNDTFDLGCTLAPYPDVTAQVGAVSTGDLDAIIGSYSNFAEAVDAGQLRVVVDTRKPETRDRYVSELGVEGAVFGLADRLSEKREAVVRYLRAIDKARKFIDASDTEELVRVVSDLEAYKGLTPEAIANAIEGIRPYLNLGSSNGHISPQQWDTTLERMKLWNIPEFDASSPSASYDEVVDMSYLEEALGNAAGRDR